MIRSKLLKSEVIKLFNTSKETLRHYEQEGLLSPEVNENNYRLYDFKDIQKLREIFLFRDLELTISEMKHFSERDIKKTDYVQLLKKHDISLRQKIHRLDTIRKNIKQLTEILENDSSQTSYLIRTEEEREFYIMEALEEGDMATPKSYYDKYKHLIEADFYSERTLKMVYHIDSLATGDFQLAKLCLELPIDEYNRPLHIDEISIITLPAGLYLSVFYPYKHGKFDSLKKLKSDIDAFLKENKLVMSDTLVMETEHPELSVFLDESTSVFELQFHVQKL